MFIPNCTNQYFYKLLIAIFLIASILGCSVDTYLEAKDIRHINNEVESLQFLTSYDSKSHSPIGPKEGLDSAIQQSVKWDPNAELVSIERFFGGKDEAKLWHYSFKNKPGNAWLRLIYGSNGIVDVMQRKMNSYVLDDWPGINKNLSKVDWKNIVPNTAYITGLSNNDDPIIIGIYSISGNIAYGSTGAFGLKSRNIAYDLVTGAKVGPEVDGVLALPGRTSFFN